MKGEFNQAKPATLQAISAECISARTKFPGRKFLLAALTEEVGELAKALLQGKPKDEIDKEAIQVACIAVRIIEEGDETFENAPPETQKR